MTEPSAPQAGLPPAQPPPAAAPQGYQPIWDARQTVQPTSGAPHPQAPPPGGFRPPPGTPPPAGPTYAPGPRPTPPRRSSAGTITCVIVVVVVLGLLFGGFALMAVAMKGATTTSGTTWVGTSGDTVGVIKISGIISTMGMVSPFFGSTAGSESITNQLRGAARDSSVKAIVLRINSPGGSAAGSQEVYQAVEEYRRETGNPVVASMGDVAASGGYYVAAPCTKIVALPATMTGSIGVIMETIEYHQLMRNLGVEPNTITSGPLKDMGSALRAMTPEDRKIFRAMIDDVYDQFVEAVATGRGMDKAAVKKLADGRAYTGRQAQGVGLVDQLGGFHDAIQLAASEAGIRGEPTVRFFGRVSLLDMLTGEVETAAPIDPATMLLLDSRLWSLSRALTAHPTAGPRLE